SVQGVRQSFASRRVERLANQVERRRRRVDRQRGVAEAWDGHAVRRVAARERLLVELEREADTVERQLEIVRVADTQRDAEPLLEDAAFQQLEIRDPDLRRHDLDTAAESGAAGRQRQ